MESSSPPDGPFPPDCLPRVARDRNLGETRLSLSEKSNLSFAGRFLNIQDAVVFEETSPAQKKELAARVDQVENNHIRNVSKFSSSGYLHNQLDVTPCQQALDRQDPF